MFFVALLCVLGAAAQAANATLADLYNAATQEVGSSSDSYTFFNYTGTYGQRTKAWATSVMSQIHPGHRGRVEARLRNRLQAWLLRQVIRFMFLPPERRVILLPMTGGAGPVFQPDPIY
jgi:hypothetical protein